MAEHDRQSVLEELLDVLLADWDPEVFLAGAAEAAASRLGLAAPGGCALAVNRSRRPLLSARSAGLAAEAAGFGPGSPAGTVLGGGPDAVVPDVCAEQRWSAVAGAGAAGVRSVAAVALPLAGERGVLACYSGRPNSFGPLETGTVRGFAAAAAKPLRLALLLDMQTAKAANLQAALESRTVVDLAAGIIMGQNGCSQQAAIDILRSVSNSRNIKIRNVAAGVVAAVSDRVDTHFDE
ncbi:MULTISPECIES: ANTAR domain-containing protein [unclassified Arthrobacter]|uniref:ANTAR domain-containing protein n=1 Tax=unclassified Arthrobacter TaxID=235627 RepID=UPI002540D6E0|nr:ANTAR domain-containing protein [Arthrobacter sp. zg-Y1143]MCC9179088.1 ANTAR domain-containing protein [Arthrobacter sp. zg-Y750]MDK1328540.1 ANTAR domain-containing protein [Arthrobacter sp. zg-Y1143]